jgi:hypothetical protein
MNMVYLWLISNNNRCNRNASMPKNNLLTNQDLYYEQNTCYSDNTFIVIHTS